MLKKKSQIWSTLSMQLQYVFRKDLFMLRITRDVVIRVNLLNLLPSVAASSMVAGSALSPLAYDLPSPSSNTHLLLPWCSGGLFEVDERGPGLFTKQLCSVSLA